MYSCYNNGYQRQLFAGFTGGLCLFISGSWSGWTSPFLHKLKAGEIPFNVTVSERSWIVSLTDFGNVFSPIPTGYIMDILGRKWLFIISAIIFQISWLLTIFANGANQLYVARFLAGLGEGISYTVSPMYLAEIAETKIRGTVSGLFTVLVFSGVIVEFVIGPILPNLTVNIISSIIPLVFFLLVLLIPESPYYLLMKNNLKGAYKAFWWLRRPKKEEADETIQAELEIMNSQVQKEMQSEKRWINLIDTKATRRATFVVMSLSVMQRFSGIATMLQYMSTTLPSEGGGLGPQQSMILFAVLLLASSLVCMITVEWIGRKPALLMSGIVCAILQGINAVYFYLDSRTDYEVSHLRWIPYVSIMIFAVFYQIGLGAMSHTLLGEMFPANVRSKAASAATTCFALSTFLLNKIFPIISETYGPHYMFLIFCITNILVAVFTYIFVIETKGKTFGQIQEILSR
ncbi:facilitated trehalose transporter Tret1-like [Lycorma delicatula]|uniref:facilitated trehalose transporter Tret1-like n=1 Tax=Lycorma delicatula TaxID=130591 RepID=UPI003F511CC3